MKFHIKPMEALTFKAYQQYSHNGVLNLNDAGLIVNVKIVLATRINNTVIVVRQGLRLHAYANVCPHDGVPMAWRKDRYLNAAGDRIVCAAHGALFDIATGVCTLGPCLGDALTPVPLVLQANGDVHLANPKK